MPPSTEPTKPRTTNSSRNAVANRSPGGGLASSRLRLPALRTTSSHNGHQHHSFAPPSLQPHTPLPLPLPSNITNIPHTNHQPPPTVQHKKPPRNSSTPQNIHTPPLLSTHHRQTTFPPTIQLFSIQPMRSPIPNNPLFGQPTQTHTPSSHTISQNPHQTPCYPHKQ